MPLSEPRCWEWCPPAEAFTTAAGVWFEVAAARPAMVANAWGEFDGIRITVDGDLTVADLKAILDSLPLKAEPGG